MSSPDDSKLCGVSLAVISKTTHLSSIHRVVRNIVQALHLLHELVVPAIDQPELDFDLRQRLYYVPRIAAPRVTFTGLVHIFTVMIGRLSYADPPEWLSGELQVEIEKITGEIAHVFFFYQIVHIPL